MDYEERKKSYFRNRGQGRLIWSVIGIHALVVGVPLLYSLIWNSFVPKTLVIEVGLAEAPKGDSLDVPQTQTQAPESKRETVPDLPVPQTVNEPVPNVEQLPPDEPVVEPEPVKTAVEPVTAPKEETKKPEQKTEERKKILRPEDIKVDRTVVVKTTPASTRPTTTVASTNNNTADQLKELSGKLQKYGTQNPGSDGVLSTKEMNDYLTKLKNYIEPKWKQPDASSLNNKKPSATISLTIDKNGRITAKKISGKSGVAVMDRSIEELLDKLTTVPVPPQGNFTIPVTLTVR